MLYWELDSIGTSYWIRSYTIAILVEIRAHQRVTMNYIADKYYALVLIREDPFMKTFLINNGMYHWAFIKIPPQKQLTI